jgi:hypothetical protein
VLGVRNEFDVDDRDAWSSRMRSRNFASFWRHLGQFVAYSPWPNPSPDVEHEVTRCLVDGKEQLPVLRSMGRQVDGAGVCSSRPDR